MPRDFSSPLTMPLPMAHALPPPPNADESLSRMLSRSRQLYETSRSTLAGPNEEPVIVRPADRLDNPSVPKRPRVVRVKGDATNSAATQNVDTREPFIEKTFKNAASVRGIRFDTLSQDRSGGDQAMLLCALLVRKGNRPIAMEAIKAEDHQRTKPARHTTGRSAHDLKRKVMSPKEDAVELLRQQIRSIDSIKESLRQPEPTEHEGYDMSLPIANVSEESARSSSLKRVSHLAEHFNTLSEEFEKTRRDERQRKAAMKINSIRPTKAFLHAADSPEYEKREKTTIASRTTGRSTQGVKRKVYESSSDKSTKIGQHRLTPGTWALGRSYTDDLTEERSGDLPVAHESVPSVIQYRTSSEDPWGLDISTSPLNILAPASPHDGAQPAQLSQRQSTRQHPTKRKKTEQNSIAPEHRLTRAWLDLFDPQPTLEKTERKYRRAREQTVNEAVSRSPYDAIPLD